MKICHAVLKLTLELWIMCFARRLMVLNVCKKLHEGMSSNVKVMELTRKL